MKKKGKRLGNRCNSGGWRGSWGTCCTSDGAWELLGTQNIMAAKPKHKRKKGRVRVQRRNFRRKGKEKRGIGGAGGFGGIGGRADTKQQGQGRRIRTFLGPVPGPSKKDLKKVQCGRACLRRKGRRLSQETHGSGVWGKKEGHLFRVERWMEVLWGA